jgi:hypothetical protein
MTEKDTTADGYSRSWGHVDHQPTPPVLCAMPLTAQGVFCNRPHRHSGWHWYAGPEPANIRQSAQSS